MIDVHGQAHPANLIELGYIMDPSNFNLNVLPDSLASTSSLNKLKQLSSQSLEELIRGNTYSFGALLYKNAGYQSVPSPNFKSASSDPFYYNGGPITYMYTTNSQYNQFKLAGFQMELPTLLRNGTNDTLVSIGKNLASCIYDYYYINSFDKTN